MPPYVWYGTTCLLLMDASGHCLARWRKEGHFVYLGTAWQGRVFCVHGTAWQDWYFVHFELHCDGDLECRALASLDIT
jgi:hypothetical protein